MKLTFAGILADAWRLGRRDADLLLRVAGVFLFLPFYALVLLVPPWPLPDEEIVDAAARMEAWRQAFAGWLTGYGLGYVAASVVACFGSAVIVVLYCDPARRDVRGAIASALRLFPRFFLAMAIVSAPMLPVFLPLLVAGLYVVGRILPAAAVIVAERPIGVGRAIGRAFGLSRGNGLALAGAAAFACLGGLLAGQPLMLLDQWLRGLGGGNPVAVAVVDAGAAAVATLTQVALMLVAVVAYRRLAR